MLFEIKIVNSFKNFYFPKEDFGVRRNDWQDNKRRLKNRNYVLKQLTK